MSCRALGLGIEDSFLAQLANQLAQKNVATIFGQLQFTDANLACRQFYHRNGFISSPDDSALWSRSLAEPLVLPPHVSLTVSGGDEAAAAPPHLGLALQPLTSPALQRNEFALPK